MKDAANALRWCVAEMERRYKIMSAVQYKGRVPKVHWTVGKSTRLFYALSGAQKSRP